jgi:hypothetical protein
VTDDELARDLARLRAATPPPSSGFTDGVMARLRAPSRRTLWQALWAPRTLRLRVRLPSLAMALVALAALGVVAVRRLTPRPELASAPAAAARVLVRFTLAANGARAVSLAGDFNDWRPEATPLVLGADGHWSVVVPLTEGSWSYSFVVDGKWVVDPQADSYRDDGFGGQNAIVRVSGAG